jgi:pyocin large subunit-like protein
MGMNNSRLWLAVAGAILLVVFATSLHRGGPFQNSTTQTISTSVPSGAIVWSHGPDGPQANAEEHWEKHGGEFRELHSEQDYVNAANAFVHHPPPGTQIKRDARGDVLFYQPSTDTFAVMDARGEPRTFFKPDNGMAYWSRQ